MNSDVSSRTVDAQMGLQNFVRLSFNKENPMKHIAKNEGRISRPVMLQIKLEVVLKPGVLFFDSNALDVMPFSQARRMWFVLML